MFSFLKVKTILIIYRAVFLYINKIAEKKLFAEEM